MCTEVKVDCFEFDLDDGTGKKCRKGDMLTMSPDPDKDKFCGSVGPSDERFAASKVKMTFRNNGDGNVGKGFACSVECLGRNDVGGCSKKDYVTN